jgi:hypothetical protein
LATELEQHGGAIAAGHRGGIAVRGEGHGDRGRAGQRPVGSG